MKSAIHGFVTLALCVAASSPARAETVVLNDPRGDDHGPGTYIHPATDGFRPGTFDLTRLTLERTGRGVTVTATFAASPQAVRIRSNRDDPGQDAFMPMVDIYVAAGPAPGTGHRDLLPGRRVRPSGGYGWDQAVVISATPDRLRTHYARVAPDLAADTCFPLGARVVGRNLRVFVPGRCLPADLSKSMFLVLVSGLGPGAGLGRFLMADGETPRPEAGDPYIREVGPNAGLCNIWEDGVGRSPCTFGGCRPCGWHPWVLDAIVPEGLRQEALLADYSKKDDRLAALPFVDVRGRSASPMGTGKNAAPAPATEPRHPVVSTRKRQITIRVKDGIAAGTLGALVCPGDKPGGTVVVRGMVAGFTVLEKVGDDSPPCKGAEVEF